MIKNLKVVTLLNQIQEFANMNKCKLCDEPTNVIFNIDFTATPICELCARAIFIQQAAWYANPINDNTRFTKQLLELTDGLEEEASLITEAVGDVITIARLNTDEGVAEKLIREQFVVIDRQDLEE